MSIIQADDRISVRANKTDTGGSGRKLGLSADWKKRVVIARDDAGEPIVYSYWNGAKGRDARFISPKDYMNLGGEEGKEWVPCFEREAKTSIPETFIRLRDNSVYVQVQKLSSFGEERLLSSRYRSLLDVLHAIRPGVLEYTDRGGGERSFLESSRNILKRHFSLHEYEYDLVIADEALGARFFDELRGSAKVIYPKEATEEGNQTLYMKGYEKEGEKKPEKTIKVYDWGKKNGRGQSIMRLEVTLRGPVFKRLGVSIADMTLQEKCIGHLQGEVMQEILSLKGGEAVARVQRELFTQDNILALYVRMYREQAKMKGEVEKVKSEVGKVKDVQDIHGYEIEELKRVVKEMVREQRRTSRVEG